LVPDRSLVMERIEFVGSNLFIPLFLVSVGMLIDPAIVADRSVLGFAAVFIAVAIGTKAVAAVVVGAFYRYDRAEVGSMFALSSAQAAATLAAVVVAASL
jgi:Kef-type K+ transport system membrane component KefB